MPALHTIDLSSYTLGLLKCSMDGSHHIKAQVQQCGGSFKNSNMIYSNIGSC